MEGWDKGAGWSSQRWVLLSKTTGWQSQLEKSPNHISMIYNLVLSDW